MQFDCIASWSLLFHLLSILMTLVEKKNNRNINFLSISQIGLSDYKTYIFSNKGQFTFTLFYYATVSYAYFLSLIDQHVDVQRGRLCLRRDRNSVITLIRSIFSYKLSHDMTKPNKMTVRPPKTQINLGIRPV